MYLSYFNRFQKLSIKKECKLQPKQTAYYRSGEQTYEKVQVGVLAVT